MTDQPSPTLPRPMGSHPDRATPPKLDARRVVVLVIGVVATIGFAFMRLLVALDDRKPFPVDLWWHDLMVAALTTPGVVAAWIPGIVGGTIGVIVIAIVIIVVFVWRGRRWDAVNLGSAIVIVVAIGAPLSYVIARARPSDSLAETVAASFPSGHTAVATTLVITLGLLLRRWYIWTFGAAWVVWMMWSRTYLHAHWASDVVAGLFEGIAVACLVWVAVEALRDRQAARARAAAASSEVITSSTPPVDGGEERLRA